MGELEVDETKKKIIYLEADLETLKSMLSDLDKTEITVDIAVWKDYTVCKSSYEISKERAKEIILYEIDEVESFITTIKESISEHSPEHKA